MSGDKKLAFAVLEQAVNDLKGKSYSSLDKARAQDFLLADNRDLDFWLKVAGATYLKEQIQEGSLNIVRKK